MRKEFTRNNKGETAERYLRIGGLRDLFVELCRENESVSLHAEYYIALHETQAEIRKKMKHRNNST